MAGERVMPSIGLLQNDVLKSSEGRVTPCERERSQFSKSFLSLNLESLKEDIAFYFEVVVYYRRVTLGATCPFSWRFKDRYKSILATIFGRHEMKRRVCRMQFDEYTVGCTNVYDFLLFCFSILEHPFYRCFKHYKFL